MLKPYQQKIIDLFSFNSLHVGKNLSDGDRLKLYTDHLKTLTEIELEENIRVVAYSIDAAFGPDYAKKNPSLVAAMLPHVQMDVRDYVQKFVAQFHVTLKEIEPSRNHKFICENHRNCGSICRGACTAK